MLGASSTFCFHLLHISYIYEPMEHLLSVEVSGTGHLAMWFQACNHTRVTKGSVVPQGSMVKNKTEKKRSQKCHINVNAKLHILKQYKTSQ